MDISIILFLIFGLLALGGGFILDGGTLSALLGPTAAMIVFGGTIGAVGVSFPLDLLKKTVTTTSSNFLNRLILQGRCGTL